jgi:hypothetical protein
MLILLGSRGRDVEVGAGQFHCPACGTLRPYKHRRIGRYFTVYFIPLFQIEKLAEYIECQVCHHVYPPEILHNKPSPDPRRIIAEVSTDLESGVAVQKVQAKLMNTGLNEDVARKVIELAAGHRRRICGKCGAQYADTARFCVKCGNPLSDA